MPWSRRRSFGFTKADANKNHRVRMSYGGTLLRPRLERLVPVSMLRGRPQVDTLPYEKDQ